MKNRGAHSRFELAEGRISELEDGSIKMIQSKQQKDKRVKRNEQSLRDLWDTNDMIQATYDRDTYV